MTPFISKLSPEQWAEVRRLRADGATFADLGNRFGLSPVTISKRARKEGWHSPEGAPGTAAAPRRTKARQASPDTLDTRRRLAQRFYSLIEFRKRHTLAGSTATIELWQPMALAIGASDTFTITAGCEKQFATCQAKFANATNFRGFPHMPGQDYVLAVAKPGEPVTTARMANGE